MILKGNQRGGAKNLALHLMKDENEHIELHELRGFASQNLKGALNEAYAVSRGTQCKQFLYSLSLNPPEQENVPVAEFEAAIEKAEEKLGLTGQPRAIVFHEKEGRRHAHAVWSRIDIQSMTAVQMSFDHEKLKSLSRELFLEHEWRMPAGLAKNSIADPRNFTLAEYQQARRVGKDPRTIKTEFQDAWAISDSRSAFVHALQERGYRLARGDKRGFVAVDYQGEVYAIAKWANIRTKQVRARLGDESELPGVAETKRRISNDMLPRLDGFRRELEDERRNLESFFEERRRTLVRRQRAERQAFRDRLEQRRAAEALMRQARFRTGIKGVWDRLRGEHARIRKINGHEAEAALICHCAELDAVVFRQLDQRRHLNLFRIQANRDHEAEKQEIEKDTETFKAMRESLPDPPAPRRTRRRRGPSPER